MNFLEAFDAHYGRKPEPVATSSSTGKGEDTAYGMAALAGECAKVGAASEGTRNDTLNTAAYKLGRVIGAGELTEATAVVNLADAARGTGLGEKEIATVLRENANGGLAAGTSRPRQKALRRVEDVPLPPDDPAMIGPTDAAIAQELAVQRVRRTARRLLDAEEAAKAFRVPPSRFSLTEELAIPEEEIAFTVAQVLPAGGNVLLTAAFKAGKTTLVNQLTRALADQEPFLGRFEVADIGGRVALWNYEVGDAQYRRWLREVGIRKTDAVAVLNLRGYRVPVGSGQVEDWIVAWLVEREVKVWVVDPFARAFVGAGRSENDNTEVGAFLDTLDVIKNRAGVAELILPTHTGRAVAEEGEEHARGATRLDDWADVRWLLTKDENETRFFSATGRDVAVAEEMLTFDETHRGLTYGGGDRGWERRRRIEDVVLDAIRREPGISLRGLRLSVRATVRTASHEAIDSAVIGAERGHRIQVERGSNGSASRHYVAGFPVARSSE